MPRQTTEGGLQRVGRVPPGPRAGGKAGRGSGAGSAAGGVQAGREKRAGQRWGQDALAEQESVGTLGSSVFSLPRGSHQKVPPVSAPEAFGCMRAERESSTRSCARLVSTVPCLRTSRRVCVTAEGHRPRAPSAGPSRRGGAMAPKKIQPAEIYCGPDWVQFSAERTDAYRARLAVLASAAAQSAAGASSSSASSPPQAASGAGGAEPSAAPSAPGDAASVDRPKLPSTHGLLPPLSFPASPDDELQALRFGRLSAAGFSPARRAIMVCGRPVVAPPAVGLSGGGSSSGRVPCPRARRRDQGGGERRSPVHRGEPKSGPHASSRARGAPDVSAPSPPLLRGQPAHPPAPLLRPQCAEARGQVGVSPCRCLPRSG